MAGTDMAALEGFFKTRFGELQDLLPEWAMAQQAIPFNSRKLLGLDFREPMKVSGELGATFQSQANLGKIGTLNAAVPLRTVNAIVAPSEVILRSQVSYGAIMAALNEGPAAFGDAFEMITMSQYESHRRFIEIAMFYGQSSLGAVSANNAGSSSTNKLITLTAGSWAPGIWVQMEGVMLDIYQADGVTLRNANGTVQLTEVSDEIGRVLSLTFGSATDAGNVAATDLLVFKGVGAALPGSAVQMFAGFDAAIQNTGTMFGYTASAHNLLRGATYDVGSRPLVMSAAQAAATRLAVRGGYGKVTGFVSPYAWTDMNDDAAALRRFGESTKSELDIGTRKITYWGVNGEISLVPDPMVKNGEAFFVQTEHWLRSGVSDIVYRLPGIGEDKFFLQIPDQTGVETRNYSSQFLLPRKPAKNVKLTNIVSRSAPT